MSVELRSCGRGLTVLTGLKRSSMLGHLPRKHVYAVVHLAGIDPCNDPHKRRSILPPPQTIVKAKRKLSGISVPPRLPNEDGRRCRVRTRATVGAAGRSAGMAGRGALYRRPDRLVENVFVGRVGDGEV